MAAWKHGRRASVVTDAEAFRYRLKKADSELPDLVNQYIRAMSPNISEPELEVVLGLTALAMIRKDLLKRIKKRGVEIKEPIFNSAGKKIGTRIKANPLFKALHHVDKQLGITADDAGLSRRSQERGGERHAVVTAAFREARLRAAKLASQVSVKKI